MLSIKTKMIFAGLLLGSLLMSGCSEYNAKITQEKYTIARDKITKEVNQERQRKLDAANRKFTKKQNANKVKMQIRINDAYAEKDKILDELQADLDASIQDLDRETKAQLKNDENSFISANKGKIQRLKKIIRDKRSNIHRKIEETISGTADQAEQKLRKKLKKKINDYSKIEDDINNEYAKTIKRTQNKNIAIREARFNILRENINAKNITNEEVLSLQAEELERERMLIADKIRQEIQHKNSIIINNKRNEHAAKMDLLNKAVKAELSKNEKAALDNLAAKYNKTKSIRKSKKDQDIANSLQYIAISKLQAKKAKRKSLIPSRDNMLADIDKAFDSGVKKITKDEVKGLEAIKTNINNKNLEVKKLFKDTIAQKTDEVLDATKAYVQDVKDSIGAKNTKLANSNKKAINMINSEADASIESQAEQALAAIKKKLEN